MMKSNGSKSNLKTKRQAVVFDADALLGSLRGHAVHLEGKKKLTLRTSTIRVPAAVKAMKPGEIHDIRVGLNLSQPLFARVLNVPVTTARSWEAGRRKPTGAALRLLDLVRRSPELVLSDFVCVY